MGGGSLSLTKAGSRKSEARSLVSHIVRRRMSTSGLDEEVGKVGDEVRWVRWGSGGSGGGQVGRSRSGSEGWERQKMGKSKPKTSE